MSSYVPAALRRLVADRAEGLCEYCLIHEQDTFVGCQVEHIISEKHSGKTEPSNLALACVFCNRFKGTDIAALAPRSGRLCRLFNARDDHWTEHFRLHGNVFAAVTDIGDATITLLRMNDLDRVLEREVLIRAGRYPSESAQRRILNR